MTLSRFGTVLVSGGRPPLALWATRDGESWTAYDIPSEHNRLVPPAQRFCPEYSRGVNDTFQQSSGYTSINVLSATSALVCYNRDNTFHFADCNKPPSQSTIFCMRVRDDGGKLTPGDTTACERLVCPCPAGLRFNFMPMALSGRGSAATSSSRTGTRTARPTSTTNTATTAASRPAGSAQAAGSVTSSTGSGACARSDATCRMERADQVSRTGN